MGWQIRASNSTSHVQATSEGRKRPLWAALSLAVGQERGREEEQRWVSAPPPPR